MEFSQALELINHLFVQHLLRPLTDVEILILRGGWERQTYGEIAATTGYASSYLHKDAGPQLWRNLSIVLGEPVSKTNFKSALERCDTLEVESLAECNLQTSTSPPILHCHTAWEEANTSWGEATDVSVFFGRSQEQETLHQWIIGNRCRFILLLGMGGIGKTALSIKVGQSVQSDFEFVIWRSLRNAPPILDLLLDLLKFLSQKQDLEAPRSVDLAIAQLLQLLRNYRCLLILDNVEAILQTGDRYGNYRSGYEGYGQLFRQVGETSHLSCLLITSRERPQNLATRFGQQLPMRCITVGGLSYEDGQALLSSIGNFSGTVPDRQSVIDRYAGNPLALKIMASFASEVFAGDLSQLLVFLGQSSYIFDDIRQLLDQQIQRLSDQEREVMTWLAIRREPVVLQELREDLVYPVPPHELLQVLADLQSRSLIEKVETLFTQQPVVMEYITTCLTEQMSQQICDWQVGDRINDQFLFQKYALIQAEAREYVRDMQSRLILQPVLARLTARFGDVTAIEQHLKQMLQAMRLNPTQPRGYAAGNIINILRQLGVDLAGYNFSQLPVWQADLQGITLHDVDFSQSDLSKSQFSQVFGWIPAIAFSPDGTYWAAGDSTGLIHLWFQQPQASQITLKAHDSFIFTIAISPDSRLLVSGSTSGTIKLWDARTGNCLSTLNAHHSIVWCVVFSQDSQWFASSCEDGTIKLWDCKTGSCFQTLNADQSSVRSIVLTSDQRYLVSGSADHLIKVWDLEQGKCIRTLTGHSHTVWTVAISPDDRYIVSGGNDYVIKLWDLRSGDCLYDFEGHTLQIWQVAFSPDGQTVASASMDQTVRLWNIQDRQCTACFRGHSSMVMSVAFAADGKTLASGGMDRLIKQWDLTNRTCARTWSGYRNIIWSVAFSADGKNIASSSLDGIVRRWQVANSLCMQTMKHPTEVHAIVLSPDDRWLVSGNLNTRSTLKVWDVETGNCFTTIPAHVGKVNSVCFHPEGELIASGGDDKNVQIFNLKHQQIDRVLQGHKAVIWSVAFSPDGKRLASGSFDQMVRIWDVASGQCLHTLSGHTNALTTIVFHPALPWIATASSDATVRLWSVETGVCDRILNDYQDVVMGIAFSPDGQTFATGSFDKTVRIWNVASWECRAIFSADSSVHCVAFSPDGQTLISGGDNGTLQLWDLRTQQCIKVLELPALYSGMNVRGARGLNAAQQSMLLKLGAIAR
ncbi:NB-ARC domain-containing protein [Leptolyngbya ohadii]|uniref:WD40 domain-containing protein n=1 Tax=Leptolyngbya ohadii TaxID=1962290 RepID=UPI000B5A1EFD|nr:NB-ARC domain-containing protein [Leptolyngbya ohadii]